MSKILVMNVLLVYNLALRNKHFSMGLKYQSLTFHNMLICRTKVTNQKISSSRIGVKTFENLNKKKSPMALFLTSFFILFEQSKSKSYTESLNFIEAGLTLFEEFVHIISNKKRHSILFANFGSHTINKVIQTKVSFYFILASSREFLHAIAPHSIACVTS